MPFVGGSALLSEQVKVPSGFMPKASYSKNMLRITSLVTWPRISRSSSGKISMITRPQRFPEFSYRGSLSLVEVGFFLFFLSLFHCSNIYKGNENELAKQFF